MSKLTKEINAIVYKNGLFSPIIETVICDIRLDLYIDNKYYSSLYTIPNNIDFLIAGYIFFKFRKVVKGFLLKENRYGFDVYLNLENIGPIDIFQQVPSQIEANSVFNSYFDFDNSSSLFKKTAGVHNTGLYISGRREIFFEDISRQSAILKIIGYLIVNNLHKEEIIILTSSRINSEIINIINSLHIKLLLARATISYSGLEEAKKAEITVVGFIKRDRFTIFCGEKRIKMS